MRNGALALLHPARNRALGSTPDGKPSPRRQRSSSAQRLATTCAASDANIFPEMCQAAALNTAATASETVTRIAQLGRGALDAAALVHAALFRGVEVAR